MRRSPRQPMVALLALSLALLGSGCVTVYQPLVTLQRPVIVDSRLANFEGMNLLVRCLPGDYLDQSDSQLLCRQVSTVFRNQGAEVEVEVPRNGRSFPREADAKRPDLVIELKSRLLSKDSQGLLTIVSIFTFTLVPTMEEYSVAQDVTIRDADGFLLASETLQARFIEYFGAGIWGVNKVLDLTVRPDEDELTGDAPKKDFSRDFYGHLSQLLFNARVRSVVLKGFEPVTPPDTTAEPVAAPN